MSKVISYSQLTAKKYKRLKNLPQPVQESFGNLTENFIMIVWGQSGNGKSSFLMQLLNILLENGKALYVALEEGHEASIQENVMRSLEKGKAKGSVMFADCSMTYDALITRLQDKRRIERFIIIDSIQYWNIDYEKYKALKELFPTKTFIFISHAKGSFPDGKTADKIRYDAGIKVHVKGYIAFVKSRYGGNKPFVIWEEGARKHWGEQYDKTAEVKKAPRRQKNKKTTILEQL